ncbi:PREDICTED: heat shock 70 kDa protein, mitochondrial-like [Tarenaya hassleriana]|uniref:heat shock 70 kDa protein, mitochondrial-like n=1 Tax=Tarenaya hassleriana TaxID=28532 RepID=UPI00053CA9CF|nr:PREDICTED: heat shock 70 kDa protein, mitochondrial-like [Tarenaya hassleriana]
MASSGCCRLLRKASMSPLLSAIRSTPSSFAACNRSISSSRRSVLDDTPLSTYESLESAKGGTLSAVVINHKGELLVGTSAKWFENYQAQKEAELAPCKIVKAPSGDAWVEANGQKYSPSKIAAFVLPKLMEFYKEHFGIYLWYVTVRVPACFRDAQIEVLIDIDCRGCGSVLARDEASRKEMEVDFLIRSADFTAYDTVISIRNCLRKYKEKIPAEIAAEIETAVSELMSASELDNEEVLLLAKLDAAREAVSKIGQYVSKGSSYGGSGGANSMEGELENVRGGTLLAVGLNYRGELIVGTQAEPEMEMVPCKIIEAPNGDAWFEANGQLYSTGQIAAFLVPKLKEFAEAHLGMTVTEAEIVLDGNIMEDMEVIFEIYSSGRVSVKARGIMLLSFERSLIYNTDWIMSHIEEILRAYRRKIPAEIATEAGTAVGNEARRD